MACPLICGGEAAPFLGDGAVLRNKQAIGTNKGDLMFKVHALHCKGGINIFNRTGVHGQCDLNILNIKLSVRQRLNVIVIQNAVAIFVRVCRGINKHGYV